jgi:hypothetical protein
VSNKTKVNINLGCPAVIGVVFGALFVTLKICGVIEWSWLWVTAPLWGLPVFGLSVALVLAAAAGGLFAVSKVVK